jgi:hypothetical protein
MQIRTAYTLCVQSLLLKILQLIITFIKLSSPSHNTASDFFVVKHYNYELIKCEAEFSSTDLLLVIMLQLRSKGTTSEEDRATSFEVHAYSQFMNIFPRNSIMFTTTFFVLNFIHRVCLKSLKNLKTLKSHVSKDGRGGGGRIQLIGGWIRSTAFPDLCTLSTGFSGLYIYIYIYIYQLGGLSSARNNM